MKQALRFTFIYVVTILLINLSAYLVGAWITLALVLLLLASPFLIGVFTVWRAMKIVARTTPITIEGKYERIA